MEKFHGAPSEEDLSKYAQDTLNSGKVVPGYGHAVLRITDPRFDAFHAFGAKVCPDDPAYKTMARVFTVVPRSSSRSRRSRIPGRTLTPLPGASSTISA